MATVAALLASFETAVARVNQKSVDVFARLGAFLRVMRRPMEAMGLLRQRPALLLAVSGFETALMASGRMDMRLKALARIKTSALIGCPF